VSWIKTIAYADAAGRLRQLYDRVKGPDDNVDNIMLAHSLRPHTMEGHMAIYKHVLHNSANSVPKWFLETVGVWVSSLNDCTYCVEHHFAGLRRLLNDDAQAGALRSAIETRDIQSAPLEEKYKKALAYAETLTRSPGAVTHASVVAMRDAGFTDGEILEVNQVAAYFSYANRTVLGLGCSAEGDILGLSPNNSDNPDDWSHT